MININGALVSFLIVICSQINAQDLEPKNTVNKEYSWNLLEDFSDEFNGSSIDWLKWSKNKSLPNTNAWKWNNDSNVTISDFEGENSAALTMKQNARNKEDNGTYFKSGCLQSQKQLPVNFEGYVEARIFGSDINAKEAHGLNKRRGVCPSFWLYSKFYENKDVGEAIYTEIDVVELQQFDYDGNAPEGKDNQDFITDAESNLHLIKKTDSGREWYRPKQPKARDSQLNKYELPGKFDPSKGWHTYGCEITADKLHFFVDGIKVGKSMDNTYWSSNPMHVIASLGLRVPFVAFSNNRFQAVNPKKNDRAKKNIKAMPVSMYVDYIRVWEKK